jgi:hypothetical protein
VPTQPRRRWVAAGRGTSRVWLSQHGPARVLPGRERTGVVTGDEPLIRARRPGAMQPAYRNFEGSYRAAECGRWSLDALTPSRCKGRPPDARMALLDAVHSTTQQRPCGLLAD